MANLKYLLLVPARNASRYLPFFFRSLRQMNPQPNMIVWATNNNTDNTVQLLETFNEIPYELYKLPDFPADYSKTHGIYTAIAKVRQRLWERARELNAEWTFMCDVDNFATVSHDVLRVLSSHSVDFVSARQFRYSPNGDFGLCTTFQRGKGRFTMKAYRTMLSLDGKLVLVVRPKTPLKQPLIKVTTAWGFTCFSRRLLQDKRLNFYPYATVQDAVDLVGKDRLAPYIFQCNDLCEDVGFCFNVLKLGYDIHLDGTVVIDHAYGDMVPKPWTRKGFEFSENTTVST